MLQGRLITQIGSRKSSRLQLRSFASFSELLNEQPSKDDRDLQAKAQEAEIKAKPEKTQAELDEELKRKLAGISGDGGESGIEYEDGKAVAMKRSVKNNMFRLI